MRAGLQPKDQPSHTLRVAIDLWLPRYLLTHDRREQELGNLGIGFCPAGSELLGKSFAQRRLTYPNGSRDLVLRDTVGGHRLDFAPLLIGWLEDIAAASAGHCKHFQKNSKKDWTAVALRATLSLRI